MKRLALLSIPLSLALAGCVTDGAYGGGIGYGYGGPYAYDGWYDGYYGPIYDGYWGNDGYFYYRGGVGERRFRRGDHAHFNHGPNAPGGNFQHMQGSFQRGQGMHTPSLPRGGGHHGR